MSTPAPWSFPVFASTAADRAVLALCSPRGATPPAARDADELLTRAAALDLFPLAFHRLKQSGAGVSWSWEERYRSNAARNLYLHHQQARLLELLRGAGVCAAALKGTSLAELAHGDLSLRTQVDIDLYVSPRNLPRALEVLQAAGYRRTAPTGVCSARLAATGDEFTSECALESAAAAVPVLLELHWRILPLPDGELRAALRDALPPDLNLLYLSLRAAADRWGGLKLMADLAHWLERRPPDWPRVLATARRLGLRRILCLTLDALRLYFGTTVPAEVERTLASARPRRFPAAGVANPFESQPLQVPSRLHCLRLALHERRRDQARYLLRLLRPSAADLAAVSLPSGLGFLYWGVRWLRLSGLLKGAAGRPPAAVHP